MRHKWQYGCFTKSVSLLTGAKYHLALFCLNYEIIDFIIRLRQLDDCWKKIYFLEIDYEISLWNNPCFASNKIWVSPIWFASSCCVCHPGQTGEAFSLYDSIFLMSRAQLLCRCLCLRKRISLNVQLSWIVLLIQPQKRLSIYIIPEKKKDI